MFIDNNLYQERHPFLTTIANTFIANTLFKAERCDLDVGGDL